MPSTTIHKHWFGLLIILVLGLGFAALIAYFAFKLVTWEASNLAPQGSAAVLAVLALLVVLFTAINAITYLASRITYTDETITFVVQVSLFGNSVSQFELRELEDVNVNRGLGGLLFGYGTLIVQTAGTQNFTRFTYTPNAQVVRMKLVELSTGI